MTIVYFSTPWFMDCDLPLIKSLQDKGHTVYYLLSVSPNSANATILNNCTLYPDYSIHNAKEYKCFAAFSAYIDLDYIYIINYPVGSLKSIYPILGSFRLFKKTLRFIEAVNCDVLHMTGIQRHFNYLLAKHFKSILVDTMHDPIPHDPDSISAFQFWSARLFFKLPQRVFLLNKKQGDAFCKRYNYPYEKLAYAKLGSYDCTPLFSSSTKNNTDKYILFFGRIQPYKGVENLIRAMRIVHKDLPTLKLVIAGKGIINEPIDITYTTFINRFISNEEIADLLKNALFVICPYLSATQSGVVSTAFSMDVPIIATNVGGMAESISDKETGLLIEPDNDRSLADAIIYLYKNSGMRTKFIQNIQKERINGCYSWEKISDSYIRIYKKILK